MAAYRSRPTGGDPARAARAVRFRPGLHAALVGPIVVVALLVAAYLAQRGSREVAIHLHRDTAPVPSVGFLVDPNSFEPELPVGVYEVRQWRLLGSDNHRGTVRDWSRPFVLDDCRVGFASREGAWQSALTYDWQSALTYESCADLPVTPSLRIEQERAITLLDAFRRDASASSIDVGYGSRRGGLGEALAALGIGAILLSAALFRRSVVTIDHARGEIRIDERRVLRTRRRAVLPIADVSGVCVEASRRWSLSYRVTLLSRGGRAPITAGYSMGEKRNIALRLRLEAALTGVPQAPSGG